MACPDSSSIINILNVSGVSDDLDYKSGSSWFSSNSGSNEIAVSCKSSLRLINLQCHPLD